MFTAAKFHAALTTSFLIDYAQCILIEGFELRSSLNNILTAPSQSLLRRHTNLVSIHRDAQTSALEAVKLIFTHTTWHPWGSRLPASCPKCSSPQCWSKPAKSGSTYIYPAGDLVFLGHVHSRSQWDLSCTHQVSMVDVGWKGPLNCDASLKFANRVIVSA